MEPDRRAQPDPEFVRRLSDWFVDELGAEHTAAAPKTSIGAPPPRWIEIESGFQASPRRHRAARVAAAALVVAGGLGTALVMIQRDQQTPTDAPVIAPADLDALCTRLEEGYPRLPLTPAAGEAVDVARDVEQRIASAVDGLDKLSRDAGVVSGEAARLMSIALDTAGALRDAAAADDQARIDQLVTNLDGLVTGWAKELTRMGATTCEPAPTLRGRP